MPDESLPALLAQRYLGTALRVRRGENVLIETWNHTLPYAAACVLEARRLGAHPMLLLEDETAWFRALDTLPTPVRWAKMGAHEWAANAKTDAYVFFPGPADRPRYLSLPPAVRRSLFPDNTPWYDRAEKHKVRLVRSMLGYASDLNAARWGVNGPGWRNQIVQATLAPDPKLIAADAKRAAQKLAVGKELRIQAQNGTDVRLKLKGRTPTVDDGIVDATDLANDQVAATAPPGAVIVAIDERSAEGTAIANRASFLGSGRTEAGQWEMRGGRLRNYWYSEGQQSFDAAYAQAPAGKDVVSIFSLGLNPSVAPGAPQLEDMEAGAVCLGIGGNKGYGGTNRAAFLSWLIVAEATVAVDGKPLCDRGKIL